MTHELQKRHPMSAIGINPLVVSLRYRCTCANNEVLQISAVIDPTTATDEQFIWTMRRLWEDVQFEVEQHINPPKPKGLTDHEVTRNDSVPVTSQFL